MFYKRDIINFLYVASFPVYGIGSYVSAAKSPSFGYIVSVLPHILIVLFYVIDTLYKKEFKIRVNPLYWLMLVFLMSTVISLFIALRKHLPEANQLMMINKSILVLAPFHAFIAVCMYNRDKPGAVAKLTMMSFNILLLINIIGFYGLGLRNEVHRIDGRINFPFLDGLYSGAALLAIINLMLLYYMRKAWKDPVRFSGLFLYFMINLAMLFVINSRLTILIFLFVFALAFFNAAHRLRGTYILSLLTLPILLNMGLLIYQILSLPVFVSILQRVDIVDVTTFNGRAFLWKDALDWLWYDHRGLIFGSGYKAHYFLDLVSDVAKLWNVKEVHHLHLHSTSLEVLVCQGVFGFAVFAALLFYVYKYFRGKYVKGMEEGIFFSVAIFIMFIMQVDIFLYVECLGAPIFSLLVAQAAMRDRSEVSVVEESISSSM